MSEFLERLPTKHSPQQQLQKTHTKENEIKWDGNDDNAYVLV